MFLVTSDDPGKAKSFILSNQKSSNDVFFVGTIDTAIEGEMTKQDSTGKYDCDNFLPNDEFTVGVETRQ